MSQAKSIYVCENCGKTVLPENYYGSGRFCCPKCARSYSSRYANTEEKRKQKSDTLKNKKPFLHYCIKCGMEVYSSTIGTNIYCDKCKIKSKNPKITSKIYKNVNKLIKQNTLTQTNCILCNSEIFSFYKGTIYCDDCLYTHPEIEQHIALYTEDGKKISLKRTNAKLKEIQKKLVENGTHKGWQVRPIESYPEKFFKKVLKNNDIQYSFNHPITKSSLGLDTCACYFLDFFIEPNIDLEIDGKQHQYEERKEHDIERDKNLSDNGYIVYRIPWNEINTSEGKEKMKEKIDAFIQWYHNLLK